MADVKTKKEHAKEEYSKNKKPASPKKTDNVKNDGQKAKGKAKKPFAYHLIPYVFAILAIFFALCFITNAVCNPQNVLDGGRENEHILGVFGFYVCEFTMGLFGPAAYALPVLMILFVIFWKNYDRRSFVAINLVIAAVTSALISALCHVFSHMDEGIEGFTTSAKLLYEEGASLGGGGIIGGYIGFAVMAVLNVVGAIFVLIAILIPMLLFLLGTTPVEVAQWIWERIKKFAKAGAERAKVRRAEKREEAREKKELARLAAAEEKEAKRLALAEAKENARLEREDQRKQAELERAKEKTEPVMSENEELNVSSLENETKRDNECIINLPSFDEEEDKLELRAFSDSEFKEDSIREQSTVYTEPAIKDIDEFDVDVKADGRVDDTVVFTDGKAKKSGKKDAATVANMASELFDENDDELVYTDFTVDKETGEITEIEEDAEDEVITPTAQPKPAPEPIPEYKFPPVNLLEMGSSRYTSDDSELERNAEILRGVLQDFRIPIKEISCSCGPTITRYEIKPEAGVRVRQIANLVDDISMALAKSGVRIEAPIPGKAAVGIEVPNDKSAPVKLRNLIEHADFITHKSKLASCLGADVSGKPVMFDIEKMPHLLVAGTTGSGKSVCINSIIMSILYHAKPEEVKLLLIDPKKVEFKVYKDIPHLCCRIVSDPKKAAGALNTAVNEMEKRFELIEEVGVRNITGYNEITKNDPEKPYMPRMVIIIDEFADLMMTAKEEVETAVVRIAQKARAAGIHLIIGTQRPSVDVITGLIKANIPSRIAFTVMSGIDSRTIIDTVGAEKLCGRGDMLYAPVGAQKPQRVQGAFVSDEEVEKVVSYVKAHNAPVRYDHEFEASIDVEAARCGNTAQKTGGDGFVAGSGDEDPKLFEAAELAIDAGKISTSLLQRRLEVGYGRAAKIIDRLEEMGVVGPPDGNKPRKILVTKEDLAEMMNQ